MKQSPLLALAPAPCNPELEVLRLELSETRLRNTFLEAEKQRLDSYIARIEQSDWQNERRLRIAEDERSKLLSMLDVALMHLTCKGGET